MATRTRAQRRDRVRRRIGLAWCQPDEVADAAGLRAFFVGPSPRAALYFRAIRAALLAEERGEGAEPGLDPSTLREARELAAAIAGDLERLSAAAVRSAGDCARRPEFESANAWSQGERARLVGALVRVVAFDAADDDPVLRELLAVADAEIARHRAQSE